MDPGAACEIKHELNLIEDNSICTSQVATDSVLNIISNDAKGDELQSTLIQLDNIVLYSDNYLPETEAQNLISQEPIMNDMISDESWQEDYGIMDLDLDVHNDAFGLEMHVDQGEQNLVYFEITQVELTND